MIIETTSDLELIRELTPTLIVLQIFEPSHYRNCIYGAVDIFRCNEMKSLPLGQLEVLTVDT